MLGYKPRECAFWAARPHGRDSFLCQQAKNRLAFGIAVSPHVGLDARNPALGSGSPTSFELPPIPEALGHHRSAGIAHYYLRCRESDAFRPATNLRPIGRVGARKIAVVAAVANPKFFTSLGPRPQQHFFVKRNPSQHWVGPKGTFGSHNNVSMGCRIQGHRNLGAKGCGRISGSNALARERPQKVGIDYGSCHPQAPMRLKHRP